MKQDISEKPIIEQNGCKFEWIGNTDSIHNYLQKLNIKQHIKEILKKNCILGEPFIYPWMLNEKYTLKDFKKQTKENNLKGIYKLIQKENKEKIAYDGEEFDRLAIILEEIRWTRKKYNSVIKQLKLCIHDIDSIYIFWKNQRLKFPSGLVRLKIKDLRKIFSSFS